MIQSLSTNHFIYRGMAVGGEARAALIAVIFEKAMKLSGRAKAGGKSRDAKPQLPAVSAASQHTDHILVLL